MDEKKPLYSFMFKSYPDDYKKNIEIKNLDKIKLNTMILSFMQERKRIIKVFAIGGRVLNFVSLSEEFFVAKKIFLIN